MILGQILELVAHQFAKLLEPLHEILVAAVLDHCFLRVGLKLADCLHILWVGEQFLHLCIALHVAQEVVSEPFLFGLLEVIVHLHRFLHFLYMQWVGVLTGLQLHYLLLLLLLNGWCAEEPFLEASESFLLLGALDLDRHVFHLLLQLLQLNLLPFLILDVPKVWLGVVLTALGSILFLGVLYGFEVFFEIIELRHFVVRHA